MLSVSFRQACMNLSEACGIVGCQRRTLWRAADGYQEETRCSCPAGGASAAKLAGTYGIHRTAKVLRVDYYALKKRVEGAAAGTASRLPAGTTFVELPAPVWPGCGECTLELEDAGGAKLRVHLKGFGAPDLAALGRSFWQVES